MLTPTSPAARAGAVAVIVVELTTVTPVAGVPPMLTVAPARKLVPVTVTPVPPLVDPEVGLTLVTVGGGAFTVRLNNVVRVTGPAMAVAVIAEVPSAAAAFAVSVSVDVHVGEQLGVSNDAVTPDGMPLALNAAACVVPEDSVAVIVLGTDDPRTTVWFPLLPRVKSNEVCCDGAASTSIATMPHPSDGMV